MKPKERRDQRVMVSLTPTELAALREVAEDEGSNLSAVVRRAVRAFLAQTKGSK